MKANWDSKVATPYKDWDSKQLNSYLQSKGVEVKKGSQKNKQSLISQVQGYWQESANQASASYGSVKDWIFDR